MNIKLSIIKTLINGVTESLSKKVPDVEATYPINKMLVELEAYFKRSIEAHPPGYYKDRNFYRLVTSTTRTTLYISEMDSHYRAMLAVLFMQISALIQREQRKFNDPVELLNFLSGQEIRYERHARTR